MLPLSWWPTALRLARLRTVSTVRAAAASVRNSPRDPSERRHDASTLQALLRRDRDERQARLEQARAAGLSAAGAFRATLVERCPEGQRSATLRFRRDDGLPLRFLPGQFLTLEASPHGDPVARSYSLSSDPAEGATFDITVRERPGGVLSPWLVNGIQPGHVLTFAGPSGAFGIREDESAAAWWLVGAGAGATPLLSCVHGLLARPDPPAVRVLLQDRTPADALFHPGLDTLAERQPNLVVDRVYTRGPGATGRWNSPADVLDHVRPGSNDQVLLCGPGPWMSLVRSALAEQGFPEERVRTESFALSPPSERPVGAVHAVRLARSGRLIAVRDDQTLLDATREAGVALPFSCGMGGCAACRLRVVEGQVAMHEPNALSADERREGYVLTCIACPRSTLVIDA
ncbi:MAG: hypothetical protein EA398_09035 [Deltaproteobacteria bacterium]|nr:MAG: hypothetical protein EA398_09035 [Deltaproteobacteria bacterium]